MVKYLSEIDSVLHCLADPTRRDILSRLTATQLTVSEIAYHYDMSLPAVSKHLKVLYAAGYISKQRKGRHIVVSLAPATDGGIRDKIRQFLSEIEEVTEVTPSL